MKRKFTLLAAALMLLSCLAVPLGMRGQSDYSNVETSNVTLTPGTNGSVCSVNGEDGIKVGNSSKGGDMTVTVPAGTTHLHVHAAAWKGVSGLLLNITPQAKVTPTSIALTADDGIANSTPFTLNGDPSDFYFVIALSDITTSTDIKFETSIAKRFVIWGCNAEEVSSNDPTMSVSPNSIAFGNKTVGSSNQETFTVTYANLTANASVSLSGSNLTDCTFSPASFSVDASGEGSQTVTVTYAPQLAGTLNGSITVADATDELSETVTVTGTAKVAHNITIGSMTNGSVTADKSTAIEGETITLTVAPSAGYSTSSLTVVGDNSGDAVSVTNNQFTMPNEAVTVSATFVATAVDVMNQTWTGITGTSYSAWSGKEGSASDAVYAGNCAGGNSSIQLRSSNSNSGIVSTTSGGKVKKVSVTWNSNTQNDNKLDVYGKNTAYSSASDLYSSSPATKGTLIGSIVKGTSTELAITDNYSYIGLRSNSGALYITEIDITWQPSNVATPTFSVAGGIYTSAQNVEITCDTPGSTIYYTLNGTEPTDASTPYTEPISISETKTLRAIAYVGEEASAVASATYTIVTPLTSIQDIFETATTSSQNVYITFGNWIVSGIEKSNTSVRAYVTDGTNGFVIYNNSGHGFHAGDRISGTAQCSLTKTSAGYVQITNITASNVTVNPNNPVTAANIPLSSISGINVGTLVSYNDLAYDGSVLSDGETSLTPYSEIMSVSGKFTEGKKYDVTGVYFQYYTYSTSTTTKEICPRVDADIVLKADLDIDASMTPFSYIVGNGPSAAQNIDIICTDLGTNNLKATASSDYEVSLALEGPYYQYIEMNPTSGGVAETVYVRLKVDRSIGEYSGTVTFTADNLTTTTVNLEGLVSNAQAYAIDLTQPTSGIATISSDVAVAEAGATITLSYAIEEDCYEFSEWSVMYELGGEDYEITPDENNQFIMPAADVYVSAIFAQKIFAINYSVNGTIVPVLIEYVDCGENAPLHSASDLDGIVTLPTGYSLAGWSTSAGNVTTVTNFTPEADATLYAVLIPSASAGYVKVTSLQDITEGTYFIVNDGYVLPNADATNAGPVKTNDYKITTPLSDSYETLPVAGTAWTFTGTNEAMTIMNSTTNHYLYVAGTSNNNQVRVSTTSDHTWSFAVNGTGFSMKDNKNSRYCATYEAGEDWRSYNSATASNYGDYGILYLYKKSVPTAYTRIEEITSAENLPSIEPTYSITVKSGGVLTLTGPNNGDETNLIIEDGGQLICNNDVTATLQKDITAAGNWGEQDPDNPYTADGWYFIASPVNGFSTSTIATGITTSDLYSYNEPTCQWFNAQGSVHPFTTLTRGHGYLYANFTGDDLSFAGAMPATNTNIEMDLSYAYDGNLKGFNLMGNPFTCNLTSDNVKIQKGETMTDITSYYIVENGTELAQMTLSTNPIKPGRGFLIQADGEGQKLVFNPGAKRGETTNKPSFINIEAGNANFMDRACVQIGSGNTLRKMTINDNVSHVYVMHDGKDYAAATIEEAQGEMPVSFRANEDGQYTLTVNPEGVEMNYLHLVDNMTGMDVDLLQTPSYTFNAKTTDYESRFRLVFAANNNNNEDGPSTGSGTFAFFSNGSWIINNEGEATLQVIDLNGRILSSETINGSVSTNINATTGIYMVRLISGDNVKTQKVVVR